MPFVDNRENSAADQDAFARPRRRSGGLLGRWSDAGLPPQPEQSTPPEGFSPFAPSPDQVSPHTSRALIDPSLSPNTTRQLDTSTGPLVSSTNTSPLREPVVIHGSGKSRVALPKPSTRKRLLLQLAVAGLLIFMVFGILLSVTATDSQGRGLWGISPPIQKFIQTKGSGQVALGQQAATATAVLSNDGYDPGSGAVGGGGLNRFFYGQCTYWANMRYHQLTSMWVPWLGNANQWAAGARASGWIVSSTPHVPSIIVLQGGVQGASWAYGHVAIVESINADGSVHTSNWNWNGMPAYTTYVDFTPGPGVSFVWAPSK